MKKNNLLMSVAMAAILFIVSCSPKDADIQAAVQAKEANGINVTVTKGEVTLTGEVLDDAAKTTAETIAKSEKGVKSVVNNLSIKTVTSTAPVVIAEDAALQKNVTDAVKDFPSVKGDVKDGVVTLTGDIKKSSLITLMQHLSALKPKKIDNKLIIK